MAIFLSLTLLVGALCLPRKRRLLLWLNFSILIFLTFSLCWHLALDHFNYAYVWLYSAPDLKLYLKFANLWGGEEGTLLFLSLLLSGFCLRLCRYPGWAGPGVILLTLPFVVGLIIWHPFQMTTAEQLAHAPYQGMNAHLTKFWMAIHPPLIFVTYLLLLVPVGAAAEALVRGQGPWKEIALRYSRWAWVILSAGLVSGMWWAYEDYFYGQFWHWDPVQTASFVVWCWLTAYLHGLRAYQPLGAYGRSLPFLSILTAAAAVGSMLVTRNGELISSHRYLGQTSLLLLAFISGVLLLTAFGALALSFRHKFQDKSRMTEGRLMIQIAIWGFFSFGLIGCYFLGEAYVRAVLEVPKDKPPIFFALIANVSSADLVSLLKEQHEKWTVDNFSVNQMLVPIVFVAALFGGHRFLPVNGFKRRVSITILALLLSIALAEVVRPLQIFYDGTGVTSVITRRNFYQLNMLLGAVGYFSLASLLYALPIGVRRGKAKAYFNYIAPVGIIHMGVMVGLFAALCASILDSNSIREVTFPAAYDRPISISKRYSLQISRPVGDYDKGTGFQAVTRVKLLLTDGGQILDQGQTLYQDGRVPLAGDVGPIRQYCEAVDYRFARMSRSGAHMLNPFIYRGWGYDLQVWLPAINYLDFDDRGKFVAHGGSESIGYNESTEYNIVIKKFPMMIWLWIGLGLSLTAGFYYALFSRKKNAL
ncbi:MAG: cytochrome c biogenesis protein CcsA [Emcibacter sp.]|nr:cytochrome c biogenesis protein CcsA [Emcibacter sp.]